MPSENQLVQEYDLSRHTVRKALSISRKKKVISLQFMEREQFCTERALHKKESKNIAVLQPIFLIIYSLD